MKNFTKGVTEDGRKYIEIKVPDHKNVVEGMPIPIRTIKIYDSLRNKRFKGETNEEYTFRRKYIKYVAKHPGRPIWDSRLGTATKEFIDAMRERLYPTK